MTVDELLALTEQLDQSRRSIVNGVTMNGSTLRALRDLAPVTPVSSPVASLAGIPLFEDPMLPRHVLHVRYADGRSELVSLGEGRA